MMSTYFKPRILLASQSPRRQQLLKDSGFELEILKIDVEEDFPESLAGEQIPMYLAEKKTRAIARAIGEGEVLVTADTIVWLDGGVLNKPRDMEEAKKMLEMISGKKHTVYTGVCVRTKDKYSLFAEASDVYFNNLDSGMIDYYLSQYKPLDKAGAYGIQEFIGYVGIRRIEGCYYNVMGFPVSRFISELRQNGIIG